MLTFNTNRPYTDKGQRIATIRTGSGAIVMIDIDREIDYLFSPDIELTQNAIMNAYDSNSVIYPSDIDMDYSEYYSILKQLAIAANSI
jgi:hypothetical protein